MTATSASASHTAIQASVVVWRSATNEATRAVTPMTQYPQPETAVKVVLRSIVLRMTSRLSNADGSGETIGLLGVLRQGRESGTNETLSRPIEVCQVLCYAKLMRIESGTASRPCAADTGAEAPRLHGARNAGLKASSTASARPSRTEVQVRNAALRTPHSTYRLATASAGCSWRVASNFSLPPPFSTSTFTVSPCNTSPSRIFMASGSCTSRCIARFSGRAP